MKNEQYFKHYFDELTNKLSSASGVQLVEAANMFQTVKDNNHKVLLFGNGGSAGMVSHLTVDFTNAAGVRAINCNDPGLITCFSNDYGYDKWIEKSLEYYADKGDLVVLISSSGESLNIINGAKFLRDMEISLITLSGFSSDNSLRSIGNVNLWVDSREYNVIEMVHHIWLVAIVDYLIERNI